MIQGLGITIMKNPDSKQKPKLESVQIQQIISKLLCNKRSQIIHSFVLDQSQVIALCHQSKSIILSQPMLLQLNPPMIVCGDIHGQFVDLKQIFKSVGTPTQGKSYLFLGDYVDRGKQSLQCICLLLAYKIQFPDKVFLLRGNHECSQLNKIYGFYDQCKRRLSIKIWNIFCDVFKCLPAAAVIGDRIFCVHGGLSPYLVKLQSINQIIRPLEQQKNTMLNDFLWSDPGKFKGWSQNFQRGTSYCFGQDIVQKFIKKNDFDLICRSHQIAQDGYEFFADRKLITIFSCPNYCSLYDNFGAVLIVNKDLTCQVKQFQRQCLIKFRVSRDKTPSASQFEINSKMFDKLPARNSSFEKSRRQTSIAGMFSREL